MALFAVREVEYVLPKIRRYDDTQSTGYLDEMRTASTCATGFSTAKTGNMFLGIEDFVGYGFECLGGIKLNNTNVQTSLDYDTFSFSNTYTQADIDLSKITNSKYISRLQESATVPGLLLPETTINNSGLYYSDMIQISGVVFYQGASEGSTAAFGLFYLYGGTNASDSNSKYETRLCGEPL